MTKVTYTIKGIERTMKTINEKVKKIQGRITSDGFIRVAIEIQRRTENDYPLTPMDTGNLRSSYFATIKDSNGTAHDVDSGLTPDKPDQIKASDIQKQNATRSMAKVAVGGLKHGGMIFGFSANYAAAVHQMTPEKWTRPNSGNNYFLTHIRAARKDIINHLKDAAK